MKKVVLILSMLICVGWGYSQQIERLSESEIEANETPKAVAYNFVTSIINEDYAKTVDLMTLGFFFELMPSLFGEGIPIDQLFSNKYMHDIVDMRPVVKLGYEVVITDSWELESDKYFEEDSKYYGAPAISVSFNCADANNNFYDGKHGEYDTTARVLLVKEDGLWKVFGFK